MDGSVRLNLGCGDKLLPGFVNVDLANNWSARQPDVIADVCKPLPFCDNFADEVHAYHLLEHLHRWEAGTVLRDWVRALRPGGMLILELPCLDKILKRYAHAMLEGHVPDRRLTILGLYGDPGYMDERMSHRWCYSRDELAEMLYAIGLVEITYSEPLTHQPKRDMRMTARKQ